MVGAPYIDDVKLAEELNAPGCPACASCPSAFTPTYSIHKGKLCGGVYIILTDRDRCNVVDVGLQIAETLYRLYPNDFDPDKMSTCCCTRPRSRPSKPTSRSRRSTPCGKRT